jgi:hypothetical protein
MLSQMRKRIRAGNSRSVLALHVPHKLIHSNKIDWFIAEQYSSQCNILEALEPT